MERWVKIPYVDHIKVFDLAPKQLVGFGCERVADV
jgi:hypothetical protein